MQRDTGFPPELLSDIPRITLCGKKLIHIEQHKGLLAYQEEDITLMTGIGRLRIQGQGLGFKLYSASEAIIYGEIDSVLIGEERG